MTLDFTAIDFETANPYRRSVCAVAMVKVRDGRIVDRMHRLVSPPTGLDDFRNTWVHGIGPEHVRDAATWDVVLHEVADFIGPDPLVAHNAAFDSSVLVRSSEAVGYAVSGLRFVCTYRAARGLLALGSYSLPFVAAELGLPSFDHHNADADAETAAHVALALTRLVGGTTIDALAGYGVSSRGPSPSAEEWAAVANVEALHGESVCFTGRLQTMSRATARDLVVRLGGAWTTDVTRATTLLVTGDFDETTFRPGAIMTRKLEAAFVAASRGRTIQIVTESSFLELVDITDDEVASVKSDAIARHLEEVSSARRPRHSRPEPIDHAAVTDLTQRANPLWNLKAESFAFTGALDTFNRPTVRALLDALGGHTESGVSDRTTLLVQGTPRSARGGSTPSPKRREADVRIAAGQPLRVISEYELLSLLGLA